MKNMKILFREFLKNSALFLDHLFWGVFDFSKFKKINKTKIKKTLIIHTGAIGELVISTPIIKALKKDLNCEIHYMVGEGKEEILKDNPSLSKIIEYNENFQENLNKIKKEKYDLAVILFPCYWKTALMCLKAGIKYRVGGFPAIGKGPNFFLNKKTYPLRKQHAVEANLNIIKQLGIKIENPLLEFFYSKRDKEKANKYLKKEKITKYMIIHPGFGGTKSKYSSRIWPLERYSKLADNLIEKYKCNILITGLKNEKPLAEKIKKGSKNKNRIVNTCGEFSIKELGELIKKSKLVIEPSTSVGHIASALETPVISLIGRGNLEEWKPWTKKGIGISPPKDKCQNCNLDECINKNKNECMKAISVKEVLNACSNILSDKR